MAVITDADVREMYLSLYRKGEGKEEIKADGLVDPATIKAIFQALEDWYKGERATVKALMVTAKESAMTNAAAKKYGRAWLRWKWELE